MLMTFEACRFGRVSGFLFLFGNWVLPISSYNISLAHFGMCFVIRVSKAATCH